MIVRELVTRLGFSVNDSQLTKYQRGTDNIKRSAEGAADAFRNMFLAFAGFSALRSLANVADNVQSLEARMAQMTQTGENVGDTFEAVGKHATDARQDLSAYANLYIRIGNASQDLIKDQGQLLGIIDTVSQALVVGGVASSEQASAMLQLSQAFNKGKLDGDEFKSVMEAMPPAFTRSLAAAMGYTDGLASFYEASSKGKLTIDALIKALEKIGPEISRQFVAMPMTIAQSFTIISNRFQVFVARLNRESGTVTKIANFFIGAFNKIEDAMDKFVDRVGGSEQAIKLVAIAITALLLPAVAKLALGFVTFLASPLGLAIAALFLLGLAIEDVYQWMTGGSSVIGRWLGDFQAFVDELNSGILGKIWGFVTKVTAFFMDIIPVDEILSGFKYIFSGMVQVVMGLITAFIGVFKVLFGILTADWEMIGQGIRDIVAGVMEYVSGVGDVLTGVFGIVVNSVIALFKGAFIIIGAFIYETIWGNIKKAVSWLSSVPGFGGSAMPVTASTAAGAASAPAGVPTGGSNSNVTINQTLPPGSSEQVAKSAKEATQQAMGTSDLSKIARQSAQLQ